MSEHTTVAKCVNQNDAKKENKYLFNDFSNIFRIFCAYIAHMSNNSIQVCIKSAKTTKM